MSPHQLLAHFLVHIRDAETPLLLTDIAHHGGNQIDIAKLLPEVPVVTRIDCIDCLVGLLEKV